MPRSGTNVIFHSSKSLDIPLISDLYKLCNSLNYASIRSKADSTVTGCLDNAIEREKSFTRKKSTVIESRNIYNEALQMSSETAQSVANKNLKSNIKAVISNK